MKEESSVSAGRSSSRDDIDNYNEQARRRGSDISYRESSSAISNRRDHHAEENFRWRNREVNGHFTTNATGDKGREFNSRREMPAQRMPEPQHNLHDYDHHRQQQPQQQINKDSNDRNDSLNSQSRLHQYQQQQLSRQFLRHPDQDPGDSLGTHRAQEAPKQRLSIQQQHKLEYDQNEAYRQAQQQQQHALQEEQQRLIKDQEQEHSRLQVHYQSRRESDIDSTPIRHLRSNPSAQRHVGAAAAPWANELTWDRDKENES